QDVRETALVEFAVADLWRIAAQQGLFLLFSGGRPLDVESSGGRIIVFPKPACLPTPSVEDIYPIRKSRLELFLDSYFFSSHYGVALSELAALAAVSYSTRWHSYRFAFDDGGTEAAFPFTWLPDRWQGTSPLQFAEYRRRTPTVVELLGDTAL